MEQKILRFTASWCQPCKMLAKYLEGAELGMPIEVVDIDVHPEMLEEYGIRGVPTLVHLPSKKTLVGLNNTEQIKTWIKEASLV